MAVCGDCEYGPRARELVKRERDWLMAHIGEIPGLRPYLAHANYILVGITNPGITCDALRASLIRKDLVIRHCSNFPGLGAPYFRVAVRTRGENQKLMRSLGEALHAAGGTITHHHAVGRDHLPWYERETPALVRSSLAATKTTLDPANILNPGVLVPRPER